MAALALTTVLTAPAFSPALLPRAPPAARAPLAPQMGLLRKLGLRRSFRAADDAGIPCVDECAIEAYPNLPASVHPGVVTGQALIDLLEHAKENGYAIPAVNCVTSSSINACLEAARKADSPIIIQFSSGGSQFYAGKGLDNTGYKAAIAGAVSGAFHVRAMAEQVCAHPPPPPVRLTCCLPPTHPPSPPPVQSRSTACPSSCTRTTALRRSSRG